MNKFCTNCGKELIEGTKFCTNCGAEIIDENTQPESINQETTTNEENQQQSNLENEQAQDSGKETITTAKNVINKSQEFLQSEQVQNIKNSVVEKAKQTQVYLKSDEFKTARDETVNKTKNAIKRFFDCNINNNDDYNEEEKKRKYCINTIIAIIAITIILIPFYDKAFWFDDGVIKTILNILSILSVVSKIVVLPIGIIAFIKYNSINKELLKYRELNPNLIKQSINAKKMTIILLVSVTMCLVLNPIMDKVNTAALHKNLDDSAKSSSTNTSSDTTSTNTSSDSKSSYNSDSSKEYSTSSETTTNEYKIDNDFIIEYLEKINYGYDYEIEDLDEYNRYIVSGTAKKGFEHLPNQLVVYLVWIDENDNVDGRQKEATRVEQKYRLISEMRENPLWNAPPLQ